MNESEKELVATSLADTLTSLEGNYPSALLSLCMIVTEMKGKEFVEGMMEAIQSEIDRRELPSRMAEADRGHREYLATGKPSKLLE